MNHLMNETDQSETSRRAFLRACARYPILGALVLLGGVLGWRRPGPAAAEPCVKQRVCRGCRELANCSLPQALAARQEPS